MVIDGSKQEVNSSRFFKGSYKNVLEGYTGGTFNIQNGDFADQDARIVLNTGKIPGLYVFRIINEPTATAVSGYRDDRKTVTPSNTYDVRSAAPLVAFDGTTLSRTTDDSSDATLAVRKTDLNTSALMRSQALSNLYAGAKDPSVQIQDATFYGSTVSRRLIALITQDQDADHYASLCFSVNFDTAHAYAVGYYDGDAITDQAWVAFTTPYQLANAQVFDVHSNSLTDGTYLAATLTSTGRPRSVAGDTLGLTAVLSKTGYFNSLDTKTANDLNASTGNTTVINLHTFDRVEVLFDAYDRVGDASAYQGKSLTGDILVQDQNSAWYQLTYVKLKEVDIEYDYDNNKFTHFKIK